MDGGFKRGGSRRSEVGRKGEAVAAEYLTAKGWQVQQRNWRCRLGELDVICETAELPGGFVVVEVRARVVSSRSRYGTALESVDWRKQRKLRLLALQYAAEQGRKTAPLRLDVIAVALNAQLEVIAIQHVPSAF